ncbi:MAG: tetratricopeptide repeat protein [Acidobacteriota bacterium]
MKALFWLYLLVFPGALQPGNTLNQAIDQYENGAYRKSIALLSPDNPDVSAEKLLWLGKTYLKIREWDKAVQFMEKAVKLEPSNALYHLWLGRAYGSRAENRFFGFNDARRLLKEFKKAEELAPDDIDIRFDLLEFYAQAPGIVGGGKDKAWEEAEAIAKLDPAIGHTARATIYEREEKWDLAREEYVSAVQKFPDNANVHKDFAQYLLNRKEFEEAFESAAKALKLDPKSKQALYITAVSRIQLGKDLEEAVKSLETMASGPLKDEDPARENIYCWQGIAYHLDGEEEKAKLALKKALEMNPDHAMAKEYLKKID